MGGWIASSIVISEDGKFIPACSGNDSVSWYQRDADTGALNYNGMVKDGINGIHNK